MADQPSAVSGAFRQPFAEQVAYFRGKLGNLVPTSRWDDISGEAHDTAFMVAGAQKADLLADLAASIDRAIVDGGSLEAFRRDFAAAVARHDWHGWTGEGSKGGRAWRTRTIYRTNAYVSYAAGRRAQLEASGFAFWVYRHGGSRDPRPEHLHAFNGLVLPPDHPFWAKHYPPSDWGCSCYVVGARSLRAARRLGGDPDKRLPDGWNSIDAATGEPMGIGAGWGYAPGASVARAIIDKVATLDVPIARAFLDGLPTPVRERLFRDAAGASSPALSPLTSIEQLTPIERAAFISYTGEAFTEINGALREGRPAPVEAEIIAAALERARLLADITVYRGIHGQAADDLRGADLQVGAQIIDPAFASTSRSNDKALQFAHQENGVVLAVRLRGNAKALDISSISKYEDELEVLLQRGTVMKVVSWDEQNGILHVEVDA